jgi:hypothetical protein
MKSIISIILVSWLFASCTKVVDLNLGDNNSKIVIDGNVTNEVGPYYVKIAKSVSFTESNTYPSVTNAFVTIEDNTGQKDTLTYTSNGVYKTNSLQGIEGRTYTLNVNAEGTTYRAISIMPSKVNLDTLGLAKLEFAGQTRYSAIPVFTDPMSFGNNYRFIVYKDGEKDNGYYLNNDFTNNGLINQIPIQSQALELKSGNMAKVEMHCIDLASYNYYFTLSQMAFSGPGGGTTPSNPPNNISGGALGLFSAHTTQSKSIQIP